MSRIDPIVCEAERRRWLRPDWQRWMREDAHRFMPPGAKSDSARSGRADDAGFAAELNQLRAQQDSLRRMLAGVTFEIALRRLRRKYSPDQPRVPAGNGRESGQWTDGGGNGAGRDSSTGDEGIGNTREASGPSADRPSDGDPAEPERIIAEAKRLNLAARPDGYLKCLDLCFPLLERFSRPGSDRNTFDFHKCMNDCLGKLQ